MISSASDITLLSLPGFGGNYDNSVQDLYLNGSYDWDFNKKLSVTLNSTFTLEKYNVKNNIEHFSLINEGYNYLQNKFTLKYKTEKIGSFNLQYSNNLNVPLLTDIVPNYWLSNYKTFSKGASAFRKTNNNSLSANYSIADYYNKHLLAYCGVAYNSNLNNYVNNLLFTTLYQVNAKNLTDSNFPSYVAYARLEKYIDLLKGNFIIDVNSFWTRLLGIANNINNEIIINTTTFKAGYKSGFKGWLSF